MGAIFEVHQQLGPGFLETIYEKALIGELLDKGLEVDTQKSIDILI
ncbi:MAG: GxxExxY protein [bacterium]|nr:GxxExxY protein [bacterium]